MRRLFYLKGGIKLKSHKKVTTARNVKQALLPKKLVLPLNQHIGEAAKPIVAVGDKVLKGQLIARATSQISSPVHASSSGTVVAIADHDIPHPSAKRTTCIIIETDGEERWEPRPEPLTDYLQLAPETVRQGVRDAGIVGMGGAGFPAHVKLSPDGNAVETLILNAAECEPYISCDEMLLRDHAAEVVEGLRIMRHALQAKHCIIGIENDKLQAFKLLEAILRNSEEQDIELVQVPTVYPAGGEKQLIQVLTGKEVPSNGLPLDVGVVCHNVGTAYAVQRAIKFNEPLISRYVTIAGSVAKQGNLEALIGTPISDLIEQSGGNLQTLNRVIMGGPMMGMALPSTDVPMVKTTNCILINSAIDDAPIASRGAHVLPCIRCGNCATVCPVHLLPQQLYWYARAKDFDKVQDYKLFDCIECGCCDYVCPSQIPLVHYYRYAKTEIWAQEQEKQQADIARERHQFREQRQQREKQERAQRHKKKRAALDKKDSAEDPKKAAIQAAMERVRAKREAASVAPKNVADLTPQQQQLIAEADARRRNKGKRTIINRVPEDTSSEESAS